MRQSLQYILKAYIKPWLDTESLEKTETEVQNNRPQIPRIMSPRVDNSIHPSVSNPGLLPPFYVVTVNFHHENEIATMVSSLGSCDILKKMIIVDHSGSDSLNGIEADFPILVIRQPNKGYGAGINRGLKQVPDKNALVLVCNPDIAILDWGKVAEAMNYMVQNPQVGCLIPSLLTRDGKPLPAVRKFYRPRDLLAVRNPWVKKIYPQILEKHYYYEKKGEPHEVDWGSGSAILVRNALFPKPISFDERYFLYFEDVDLCAQMWRNGFTVVHYPELVVYHDDARLSARSIYYFAIHVASLLKFIYKYKGLYHRTPTSP
jgi:GT2 family glycosyltransferase